jgi:hypothetical protein
MADGHKIVWMRIAKEVLHTDVADAKDRLGMADFYDWWAYFELEREANEGAVPPPNQPTARRPDVSAW